MELKINVSPFDGEMTGYAKYNKDEIKYQYFYINRDAVIESFICDGNETGFELCSVNHPLFDEYIVNKIVLPAFHIAFEIKYKLRLSGETGCCPYVRESITPEFTFIRWETFCYPMFFDDWDSFRNIGIQSCTIQLTIPIEYDAVSSERVIDTQQISSQTKCISYITQNPRNDIFNCSIAPYVKLGFSFGSIYLLGVIDDKERQMIKNAMDYSFNYMNDHFGYREIHSRIIYASIPDGFGSFACPDVGVIFIQESTFSRLENLNQIIHEFIHLAWNATPNDSVQQARFFDEAFTCYFETRVMRNLLNDKTFNGYRYGQYGIDAIQNGQYKCVPICEYAQMKYGDLSYTIGAMCLEELCFLLGESMFDLATTSFLNKYKETPCDFESFCNEYKSFCGIENKSKLEQFFQDWIYSCKSIATYIDKNSAL
jgi:hypothetical protein